MLFNPTLLALLSSTLVEFVFAEGENNTSPSASKSKKEEFPLLWVCLGVTLVGVAIALYIAHRRPEEFHLPGAVDAAAEELQETSDEGERNKREDNAQV
ncbi:hypothetical protein ERJ75_000825100 [Trypanosoma vivax]|nr:hypothetical protein ERJ75_000825100 [Trypanosoma vivax]